jgi:hypothetical protein
MQAPAGSAPENLRPELARPRDLHRVTTEPVAHLAVVNRTVAFVQVDPAQPRSGALQIRQPGVVVALAGLFEGMWSRARDLDELPLSPIEQQVLHALTCHDNDETAARSLNVSVQVPRPRCRPHGPPRRSHPVSGRAARQGTPLVVSCRILHRRVQPIPLPQHPCGQDP